MEMYLLKSAACLAFLMLFYKLLLEKESIHVFKRYYLLAAVIISGIIPLITFQTYIEAAPILPMGENWLEASEVSSENQTSWISNFLWSVYLSGVLLFGGKFIHNFFKIVHRIRKNQKVKTEEVSTVLLPEDLPPHTFWSYIFLNKQKFQKDQIPKEVLEHEKAHAVQKHTADVLFVELLQVFLWFNPLIWLLKRSVKLNHEFLADRAVLRNGIRPATYQRTLLAFSSNAFDSNLVNSINYQSIKKRFTVMKKQPSQKAVLVKYFLFLPLLAGLLYSFSSTETVIVQETTTVTESLQKKATPEMIKEYNELVNRGNEEKILKAKDANRILYIESLLSSEQKENVEERDLKIFQAPLEQEKASPEMVAEYNKWAKRYNNNDETLVERKVWDRMNYIYRIMTPTQKNKSEKFPSLNSVEIITITEDADGRFEKRNGEIPLPPAPPVPPVTKDGNVPPPPPPPPAPPVDKVGDMPAPPPPPPSPIEAVKGWIEEGAEFFYNGKKVSGKEALEIVQKNNGKNLSVKVEEKTYSSVGNIKVSTGKTVRLTDKKN